MHAVLHLAAHGLWARWRGWVVFALLVAIAGGAVLASVAGARRTDSAYPRFLQASNASDVLVSQAGTGLGGYRALARLPGVTAVEPFALLNTLALAQVVAPADRRFQHVLDTPRVLAGRLPSPDRAGEIAVDQNGAAAWHLRVGSIVVIRALRSDRPPSPADERTLRERVVGVVVTRSSVKPISALDKIPMIFASTALVRHLGPTYQVADGALIKLRPGTTVDGFRRHAAALARQFPGTQAQDELLVADLNTQAAAVERAIRPEAVGLALFALALAASALLVIGQVAARLLAAGSADNPTLAALGATRAQLMGGRLAEVSVAAAVGAAAAAGVAVAVSPLMPVGTARVAEPDPGISADMPVLLVGSIAVFGLLVAQAAWPAWRLASYRGPDPRGMATPPGRPGFARWRRPHR